MKRTLTLLLALVLALGCVFALASCGKQEKLVALDAIHVEPLSIYAGKEQTLDKLNGGAGCTIGIPNDASNGGRALLLLAANGYITLKDPTSVTPSVRDITANEKKISFEEIVAEQLPSHLESLDYAIINSNYALQAKLSPIKEGGFSEGSASPYGNIIAVREGTENTDKIKALMAALKATEVKNYITETYKGAVVSTVDTPTDGYDVSVDYEALKGTTITVAASPTPHAEILKVAAGILAKKEITLKVTEYTDYVVPNEVVASGEMDANYFQHKPYLDDYSANH